ADAAALMAGGARRHARIDRGTAGQKRHRLGWASVVRERCQHRIGARLIAGPREAGCFGVDAETVMPAAGDSTVNMGSRSRGASGVPRAVGSAIAGNDCVFQSHACWTDADAAASTFRDESRRL